MQGLSAKGCMINVDNLFMIYQ